jgi:hypothetical protein
MTIDHPPSIMNSPIIDLSKEPPVLGISKNSLKELIVSSGFFIFFPGSLPYKFFSGSVLGVGTMKILFAGFVGGYEGLRKREFVGYNPI